MQRRMAALPSVKQAEVAAMRADVYERLTPRGKKATFTTLLTTQVRFLNTHQCTPNRSSWCFCFKGEK